MCVFVCVSVSVCAWCMCCNVSTRQGGPEPGKIWREVCVCVCVFGACVCVWCLCVWCVCVCVCVRVCVWCMCACVCCSGPNGRVGPQSPKNSALILALSQIYSLPNWPKRHSLLCLMVCGSGTERYQSTHEPSYLTRTTGGYHHHTVTSSPVATAPGSEQRVWARHQTRVYSSHSTCTYVLRSSGLKALTSSSLSSPESIHTESARHQVLRRKHSAF